MTEPIIRIDEPVRIFEYAYGPKSRLLSWKEQLLASGSTLHLGEPVVRRYDHDDKVALPFEYEGETLFILYEELCHLNKHHVRQLFPNCLLIVAVH